MEILSYINNSFNEVNIEKEKQYHVSAWACPIWESCRNSGSECQMCSELNPYVPEDQNYYSFNNWQDDDYTDDDEEENYPNECDSSSSCTGSCSSSCGYSCFCDSNIN